MMLRNVLLNLIVLSLLVIPAIVQSQQFPTPSESVKIFANNTTAGNYSEIIVQVFLPNTTEPVITRVYLTTDFGILIDPYNITNNGTSISLLTNESGIARVLLYSSKPGTANVTVGVEWGYNRTIVNFSEPTITPAVTTTATTVVTTTVIETISTETTTIVTTTTTTPIATINKTTTEITPITTTTTIVTTSTTTVVTTEPIKTTTETTPTKTTPTPGFEAALITVVLLVLYILKRLS